MMMNFVTIRSRLRKQKAKDENLDDRKMLRAGDREYQAKIEFIEI
jgi:hypothetical protein